MADKNFSVITFRQGTVSGYSPRMRLDLIVNTMFKAAIHNKEIVINNPSIWRPILSIQDAASAYIRAIEANYDINGIFNIASGNYTVGQVGDLVKDTLEKELHLNIKLNIKNIQDYRNYKVSFEKAARVLSYKPMDDIEDIVESLLENLERFNDFDNPNYYNINVFKSLKDMGGKL